MPKVEFGVVLANIDGRLRKAGKQAKRTATKSFTNYFSSNIVEKRTVCTTKFSLLRVIV
jgi:hypothetical protein